MNRPNNKLFWDYEGTMIRMYLHCAGIVNYCRVKIKSGKMAKIQPTFISTEACELIIVTSNKCNFRKSFQFCVEKKRLLFCDIKSVADIDVVFFESRKGPCEGRLSK